MNTFNCFEGSSFSDLIFLTLRIIIPNFSSFNYLEKQKEKALNLRTRLF
jgi:hypothetical protein